MISEAYVETPQQLAFANQQLIGYLVTFSVVGGPATLQVTGTYQANGQVNYGGPVTNPTQVVVESDFAFGMTISTSTNMPVDDFSPSDLNQQLPLTGPGSGSFSASGSLLHSITLQPGDYTLFVGGQSSVSAQSIIPTPEPPASLLLGLGAVVVYGTYHLRRR